MTFSEHYRKFASPNLTSKFVARFGSFNKILMRWNPLHLHQINPTEFEDSGWWEAKCWNFAQIKISCALLVFN